MLTIHREAGYRFVVYFDDHFPAHVHVYRGGSAARIRIGDASAPPSVVERRTMPTADIRRAIRIVEANQDRFLERWKEIHGA